MAWSFRHCNQRKIIEGEYVGSSEDLQDSSFFQMACALGYSLLPVYIMSIVPRLFQPRVLGMTVFRLLGVAWSVRSECGCRLLV